MPDASAAEAAERKRVMEAVAKMLDAMVKGHKRDPKWISAEEVVEAARMAVDDLRTPVGREKNQ